MAIEYPTLHYFLDLESLAGMTYWNLIRSAALSVAFAILLNGCGGGDKSLAETSDVAVSTIAQGTTPFISTVKLQGKSLERLTAVRYSIAAKTDSVSKPVAVRYALEALKRRGHVGVDAVTLPVFGLYAAHENRVSIELQFSDGSIQSMAASVLTTSFTDPNHIYDRPTFRKRRTAGSSLGFDFFFIKSRVGPPVVIDSDGEIRWVGRWAGMDVGIGTSGVGVGSGNSFSSTLRGDQFFVGQGFPLKFLQLGLDGSIADVNIIAPSYTNFHHNIERGKQGLLVNLDSGSDNIGTFAGEISETGALLHEWDFAALLRNYMRSFGDDPSQLIRPGVDWFHMNAATYDPTDDSLIVSSRENFVIKVDYQTGNIKWILGDPSKYWYTFASLRAKALTLEPGGLYPIGQHATSVTSDGLLMVFNNGAGSLNQPTGAAAGETRTYSAVSTYAVDPLKMTAREVWRFDYGQTVLSPYCSSAYETPNKSVLVSYSLAGNWTKARLVGLDQTHNVVFDFEYPNDNTGCNTSWNAQPVKLEDMQID